jgi:hypothetical protein
MVRYWVLAIIIAASACSKKKKAPEATTASGSAMVASGSGDGSNAKYAAEWNISAVAGVCTATEHAIECPARLVDGVAKVVQLEDKSCAVVPGNAKTPCPLAKGEDLPTLTWAVTAAPDGTCVASWTSPATGTKSLTIKCPVLRATAASMTIKRAKADAPCAVEHAGESTPVPCPAEPKDFTVAALRDALAKDAKPFADERVRVKGFYVKSMVAQQASGKATTYMLGVADAKGDTKNAIKCTSTAALGEAADGDEVIVEGLAKKGTNNELSLLACQATKP